ncbi:MAG: polyphenol oxidase family protein [Gemmatimonadales bacterium]
MPRLELAEWATRYGLVAGITTRGSGSGFSLGLWSDEPVGQVLTRWRALTEAFQPRFSGIALGHQVHGTSVYWHERAPDGWLLLDGVDGHATATPGLLLAVTVADCIPVYLAAPARGAVALLHAGWRGVAGRILAAGIAALQAGTGAAVGDIVMHCGVGICGECYEVGSEVVERLTGERATGPRRVDLRALLAAQAAELGVGAVSTSPWCSAHDRERFFSHRASAGRDGRMVAYLGRP